MKPRQRQKKIHNYYKRRAKAMVVCERLLKEQISEVITHLGYERSDFDLHPEQIDELVWRLAAYISKNEPIQDAMYVSASERYAENCFD